MGILPQTPKINSTIIQTHKDNLLGKRTFKFDFDKNEFITDVMGNVIMTNSANEVLKQVVNKILHDRRYKNLIYPNSYGNEIDTILNQDDPLEVVECELRRVYTEALVHHPLIMGLSDFTMEGGNKRDIIICKFTVNGVNGTAIHKTEVLNYVNTAKL